MQPWKMPHETVDAIRVGWGPEIGLVLHKADLAMQTKAERERKTRKRFIGPTLPSKRGLTVGRDASSRLTKDSIVRMKNISKIAKVGKCHRLHYCK
jgi:hypothetical protein